MKPFGGSCLRNRDIQEKYAAEQKQIQQSVISHQTFFNIRATSLDKEHVFSKSEKQHLVKCISPPCHTKIG